MNGTGEEELKIVRSVPWWWDSNVGKSTFINSFAGKACAKTGNRPGVTKGKQWIRLNKSVELLDTPGILWPKFEDESVGVKLAMIGSIKDEVVNAEELSLELLKMLHGHYEGVLANRYEIEETEDTVKMLERIAVKRQCLLKGHELDYEEGGQNRAGRVPERKNRSYYTGYPDGANDENDQ